MIAFACESITMLLQDLFPSEEKLYIII